MPDTRKKFYLTTPIYYVNARPHIGHAYSTIAADVIARRHRLLGDDTFFLTGTDEHGQKVQRSAAAAGIPPQQFADEVSATFRNLWKRMGILDDSLSKNDPLFHRDYIRTTDERHKKGVQHLFRELYKRGFIYLDKYTGAYCVSDEAFVDAPVGTPCPDCGRTLEEVTEENFFFALSAFQRPLIDLIENDDLEIAPGTVRNEVLNFVRGNVASVFGPGELRKSWAENPVSFDEMAQKAVELGRAVEYKLGKVFVLGALKDLSISRSSFTWGIPVPDDILASAGATQKHVIYVWLDALTNYMTAVGYGAEDRDDLTPEQKQVELAKFAKYWPADLHLVGKEITRFHCVYWPAFLMAAGIALPKSVVANGWLLFEESKMSKSRGNVVRTETILDAFGDEVYGKQFPESTKADRDLFAADVLRYFLLREIPFGQDGSFSFDALITRYNADLANGYGNLVSRTLNLIWQNQAGTIVEAFRADGHSLSEHAPPMLRANKVDTIDLSDTQTIVEKMDELANALSHPVKEMGLLNIAPDGQDVLNLASIAMLRVGWVDAYLTANAPWKLAKSDGPLDRQKMNAVLYTAAESIRIITALLYPILPYATAQVWKQLGFTDSIEVAAKNGELKDLQWGGLKPGTKLGALAPVFPRADKGLAQIMTDMENPTAPAAAEPAKAAAAPAAAAPTAAAKSSEPTAEALNAVGPATSASPVAPATQAAPAGSPAPTGNLQPATTNPTITIDDFTKVDLRVAQIVVAERIPKADKLLRLEVDLGPGFDPPRRQILAGIAEYYAPESLIGRKVVVVANLAPRKMRGLESQGMIVAASVGPNGAPVLAGFLEDVEIGSRLK